MAERSRRPEGARATLATAACVQTGRPSGVTIATAVAELPSATVDPDGPRCRSSRGASDCFRGLPRLGSDVLAVTRPHGTGTKDSRGDRDVR